jgi:hypothetical protein
MSFYTLLQQIYAAGLPQATLTHCCNLRCSIGPSVQQQHCKVHVISGLSYSVFSGMLLLMTDRGHGCFAENVGNSSKCCSSATWDGGFRPAQAYRYLRGGLIANKPLMLL